MISQFDIYNGRLLLAFAGTWFCLSFAGCGSGTETKTSTDGPVVIVDQAPAATESADDESPAVTPQPDEPMTNQSVAESTTDRSLPAPPAQSADQPDPDLNTGPEDWDDFDGPLPEEIAARAFDPPPGTTSISKEGRLWIDRKRSRVYVDGYVALKRGPLEMFACPIGTKEHESIVAVLAKSREVHAALLAIGASPGTPVRFRPEFKPASGQIIRVFVCWYDSEGEFQSVDARQWIQDLQTEKAMDVEWVFAGSGFWQDPEDKREYYQADSGDMICVSNFSSAMLDVAMSSSADTDSLRFVPMEESIPDRETPVRLVLIPVPEKSDDAGGENVEEILQVPDAAELPRAKPTGADDTSL